MRLFVPPPPPAAVPPVLDSIVAGAPVNDIVPLTATGTADPTDIVRFVGVPTGANIPSASAIAGTAVAGGLFYGSFSWNETDPVDFPVPPGIGPVTCDIYAVIDGGTDGYSNVRSAIGITVDTSDQTPTTPTAPTVTDTGSETFTIQLGVSPQAPGAISVADNGDETFSISRI